MERTKRSKSGDRIEAPASEAAFAARNDLPAALTSVRLSNFRSYEGAELKLNAEPVALTGPNGSGKTNLLEAISFLAPGRGLRGAKLSEAQRQAPNALPGDARETALWAVSATLAHSGGASEIGVGMAPSPNGGERRLMRLNGADSTAADIAELIPMLWLTPAMDRLFLEGASARRKFLDRLVFGLDTGHARRTVRFETAMRERARLLLEGRSDPAWLEGLEETMAETGAAIISARLDAIDALNKELAARASEGSFPCAHLALECDPGIAELTDISFLIGAFARARSRDAEAGRTTIGPHLSDLAVRHTAKRADARQCSTGEQKALLISIVLANAWLQSRRREQAPLLLLDEIAAHLDEARRQALLEEIFALRCQAWMTGTDSSLFAAGRDRMQIFALANGHFTRQE